MPSAPSQVAQAPANTQKTPPNGALFGVPNYSKRFRSRENLDAVQGTIQQGAQGDITGIIPFLQSDVIEGWTLFMTWTNTVTLAGGTLNTSGYFPYNIFGPTKLSLQNAVSVYDVESGIDWAIFTALRPLYNAGVQTDALMTQMHSMYTPETNLVSAGNYTSASATINFLLEFSPSIFIHRYFPLNSDGEPDGPPGPAWVTPQFMSGTSRVVQPSFKLNQAYGTTLDQGPYSIASGSPTYAGTMKINCQRHGFYQPQSLADAPIIHNWQIVRLTRRYPLSGAAQITLPVNFTGQITLLYLRFWDGATPGAPISCSTLTDATLQYGFGIPRYKDRPAENQAFLVREHQLLPTKGVLVWDLMSDEYGQLSNADAINTLTTAAVSIFLNWGSTPAATAYAVMGIEGFAYVANS